MRLIDATYRPSSLAISAELAPSETIVLRRQSSSWVQALGLIPRIDPLRLRHWKVQREPRLTGPLREDSSASAAYSTLLLAKALQTTVDRQASAA